RSSDLSEAPESSTTGSSPSSIWNRWSPAASTHRPSWAIPMGITSYLLVSIASSTLPAPIRDTACSELRPPKTTATRGLLMSSESTGVHPSQRAEHAVTGSHAVTLGLGRTRHEEHSGLGRGHAVVDHADHD